MKKFAASLLVLFALGQIFAQSSKREQIKAERIAFMTEELALTTEEAEKFWPIFNEYSRKDVQLRKSSRSLKKEMIESINQNQKNTAESFEKILQNEEKQIELKRSYVIEFKKALPNKKVYQVFIAEEKFKRYLLKKLRHRK